MGKTYKRNDSYSNKKFKKDNNFKQSNKFKKFEVDKTQKIYEEVGESEEYKYNNFDPINDQSGEEIA